MRFNLKINPKEEEYLETSVHAEGEFTKRVKELVSEYNGEGKILAYTEDDVKLLSPSEIECFAVTDGKTEAVTLSGERFRVKRRLYELEQTLPSDFIKINKSCIANKNRVERFSAAFSGAVDVIFKSGHTDYVSRRCFAQIKKELKSK